jgi:hypothetical protein
MRGPKRRGLLIFFVFTLGFSVLGFSFHFLHQSMDGGRLTKRSVGRVLLSDSRFLAFSFHFLHQSVDDGPSAAFSKRWTMDVFLVSNSRFLSSCFLQAPLSERLAPPDQTSLYDRLPCSNRFTENCSQCFEN